MLTIVVRGPAKSGKSWAASAIVKALKKLGAEVEVEGEWDGPHSRPYKKGKPLEGFQVQVKVKTQNW
jgi:hypothetical protein